MTDSILTTTKKYLGLTAEYKAFDQDVMMHINAAFSTLAQIGVGPAGGYMIEDETASWVHLLGDDLRLNSVKQFVYFKARLGFDPPATSFAIASMEKMVEELTWRLQVTADPPLPVIVIDPDPYNEL